MDPRYLPNQLRRLRESRNLTLEQAAEALAGTGHPVTYSTVGHWENGRRQPRLEHLAAYARALGYSIEVLFRPQEQPFDPVLGIVDDLRRLRPDDVSLVGEVASALAALQERDQFLAERFRRVQRVELDLLRSELARR